MDKYNFLLYDTAGYIRIRQFIYKKKKIQDTLNSLEEDFNCIQKEKQNLFEDILYPENDEEEMIER